MSLAIERDRQAASVVEVIPNLILPLGASPAERRNLIQEHFTNLSEIFILASTTDTLISVAEERYRRRLLRSELKDCGLIGLKGDYWIGWFEVEDGNGVHPVFIGPDKGRKPYALPFEHRFIPYFKFVDTEDARYWDMRFRHGPLEPRELGELKPFGLMLRSDIEYKRMSQSTLWDHSLSGYNFQNNLERSLISLDEGQQIRLIREHLLDLAFRHYAGKKLYIEASGEVKRQMMVWDKTVLRVGRNSWLLSSRGEKGEVVFEQRVVPDEYCELMTKLFP